MEKILHGLISPVSALSLTEKLKVARMIERSGKHRHPCSEVNGVVLASMTYWLDGKRSIDDVEICKAIFTAWSSNHLLTSTQTLLKELVKVIHDIGDDLEVVSLCDLISTMLQLFKVDISQNNLPKVDTATRPPLLEAAADFAHLIKNEILVTTIVTHNGRDLKSLSSVVMFLNEHSEIIPWEKPSSLLQCLILNLSKTVSDFSIINPKEFIHQSNQVARLIANMWFKATIKKQVIVDSLQLIFRIVSTAKELESVSMALSCVLQRVPEVLF